MRIKPTHSNQLGADDRCSALFSLLAFSSTISKHFTNVTYVDLVRKKAHVVVKPANLTWNDAASIGGQKSVDQHPQVF